MYGFNQKMLFSTILLAFATFLGVLHPVSLTIYIPLIVIGLLLSAYSSFIRTYKSYLLVRFAAYESAQMATVPSVVIQGPGTMLQINTGPAGAMIGRLLGTGYLLASRVVEGMLLSSAAIIAMLYLLFVHFGRTDPLPFVGLWLLALGLISIIASKIPIIREFTVGHMLLFSALDLARWLVDGLAVWMLLNGLGFSVNLLGLVFVMSILLILEKLPSTFMGLGQNELLGQGILYIFKIPLFPAFLSFLLWDLVRISTGILFSIMWRRFDFRRKMVQFV